MNIAIIDADIVGGKKHRFPNLACMKISAYHKIIGDSVVLKTDYEDTDSFDKVYISKVFTDTEIPCEPEDKSWKNCETIADWYADNKFLKQPNIEYGGTGFFYDKAHPLPEHIEHIFPDYHLYDEWVYKAIQSGLKRSEFTYYLDYSIGYLTRKCFRGCPNCVNRNYTGCVHASPISEFLDYSRPKICFLDDNFFGYSKWKELIHPVIETGKRFQFKQGLDERLITQDKIDEMIKWKYDGDFIFAFDYIKDKEIIVSKLKMMIESYKWKNKFKFYVFCGYDVNGSYDDAFWKRDIEELFERIFILSEYEAYPYIMRFEKVYQSKFASFYSAVAEWCNQPAMLKTFPFRLFAKCKGMRRNGYNIYKRNVQAYLRDIGIKGSGWRAMEEVADMFPDIAEKYFDRYPFGIKHEDKSDFTYNAENEQLSLF